MPAVELVAVGLDHTTAGVELRERLAYADAELPEALERITGLGRPGLDQAAILSTCNRVELYGATRSRLELEPLAALLARHHGLDPRELMGALYIRRGDDVPHHLGATAAGLHSLVLGEAQIQGQVRAALQAALAAGTAGPELRRLFESAIVAGRRARSRTMIGRGVASVPAAGVEFVRTRLGTLSDSTVLLIGVGTVGELVAKQLTRHGVRDLLVLGREAARVQRLVQRHGGRAVAAVRIDEALGQSDVVISATGGSLPIIRPDQVERARSGHADSRPLMLIDLAVPRDVDPAVAGLPGVELYTVDDLRPVVDRTLAQRRAELPAAYSVVGAEVGRFTRWLSCRQTAGRSTWPYVVGRSPVSLQYP